MIQKEKDLKELSHDIRTLQMHRNLKKQEVTTLIEISQEPSMINIPNKRSSKSDISAQMNKISYVNISVHFLSFFLSFFLFCFFFFELMNLHTLTINESYPNDKIYKEWANSP